VKTLLVPLDSSVGTALVLSVAESLARSLPAKVVLFHAIEPISSYVPVGAGMDVISTSPMPIEPEQVEDSKNRLEALAAPLRAAGIDVACEAVMGLAVTEILDQARSLAADYIVLGSHGHGAIYHLFGGSVVTGVLKHSPCPVVVVPVRG